MADVYRANGVVKSSLQVVGTVAQLIPGTPLSGRSYVHLINMGTSNVFLGGTGVTTTNGFRVGVGTVSPVFSGLGNANLYAICGDANGTVNVLEIS